MIVEAPQEQLRRGSVFGVSFPELILIFVVILLVFGPEKLPEMARRLGKGLAELRKSSSALRREFYNSVYEPSQKIPRDLHKLSEGLQDEIKKDLLEPPAKEGKSD